MPDGHCITLEGESRTKMPMHGFSLSRKALARTSAEAWEQQQRNTKPGGAGRGVGWGGRGDGGTGVGWGDGGLCLF